MPLHVFNPPEPAANPEYSGGVLLRKQVGLCGTCQSCPAHWRINVELGPGSAIPDAFGGEHILYRRIPDPRSIDAFCTWLSTPSNALADAGFGSDLAGASLWRLAFDAPPPPNSTSPYWWQQNWALHAGAYYWPLTLGTTPYEYSGGQLGTDTEEIGGFASYILANSNSRPFRCLHGNQMERVEQLSTTDQFPAQIWLEPWWP